MAQSRKIRLTKRISVSFDCFNLKSIRRMPSGIYLLPSILLHKYVKLQGFPRYVIQFNWLRLLADINIFIEDSHNKEGQKSVRLEEVFIYEAKDSIKI